MGEVDFAFHPLVESPRGKSTAGGKNFRPRITADLALLLNDSRHPPMADKAAQQNSIDPDGPALIAAWPALAGRSSPARH
jgi:hypothetical protein